MSEIIHFNQIYESGLTPIVHADSPQASQCPVELERIFHNLTLKNKLTSSPFSLKAIQCT